MSPNYSVKRTAFRGRLPQALGLTLSDPAYIHLTPSAAPPPLEPVTPFRAVVIVECAVTEKWQSLVSDWLVQSGCLYMMAWGLDCSSWDTSVDLANLKRFPDGAIPDDRFVMTTWHADEPLKEAFWFCKNVAFHPTIELEHAVLVHIASHAAAGATLRAYDEA